MSRLFALSSGGYLNELRNARTSPPLKSIAEHEFRGDGYDCEICGHGRCHYLHRVAEAAA